MLTLVPSFGSSFESLQYAAATYICSMICSSFPDSEADRNRVIIQIIEVISAWLVAPDTVLSEVNSIISLCFRFVKPFFAFFYKKKPRTLVWIRGILSCHLNLMTLGFSGVHLFCTTLLVPVAGVEPARHRWRRILSPLRLPIPSYRQICLPCRVGTDGSGRNGIVSRSMGVRTDWWYYSTFRAE